MKKMNASPLFFLTRSLFFGLGISLICKYTDKDTCLAAIIGTILGLFIILGYRTIIRSKNGKTLVEVLQKDKVIGTILRVLLLISSIFILTYTLLTYKTFVSSFLLSTTPVYMIFIPWIILLFYAASSGLPMIHKLATSLFPLSLVLAFLSIVSALENFDFYNFLPILTSKPTDMILSIIAFAGISAFPGILSLHFDSDVKHYVKYYLLSASLIVIAILCINGVFGEVLVNVFRFPEYMVLKQLKLLNFIEKVENILSIAWAFDLFITSLFSIYSIKELVPKKKNKWATCILVVIIAIIIDKVLDYNYINELFLYYALPYISFGFPILILIFFFYLLKKRN